MMLILLLLPLFAWASPASHWSTMLEVVERHEFYRDNEVILKPKGVWQALFGIVYPDRNLNMYKDCVFYKVPDESNGTLKIKTMVTTEACETKIEEKGDIEISGLKALQFAFNEREITLHFTHTDFNVTSWKIPIVNKYQRPVPKLFMSSAEYRAPGMISLAPVRSVAHSPELQKIEKNVLCHAISDTCEELSPSTCNQCLEGWFEIPNGCLQGPKYCGNQECGRRNQPACRRGVRYQRENKDFDCRTDHSFAYCSGGLNVQCEGALAWCR